MKNLFVSSFIVVAVLSSCQESPEGESQNNSEPRTQTGRNVAAAKAAGESTEERDRQIAEEANTLFEAE